MSCQSIHACEFAQRVAQVSGTQVIDVRTPAEFRSQALMGSISLPLQALTTDKEQLPSEGDIYLLCGTGKRAQQAADLLGEDHAYRLYVVEGGLAACVQEGMPVIEGRGVIALNRQVQITVGCLLLIGLWLAIEGVFFGFAMVAALGAGLLFAGVTDYCPLARLIALMPWNQ